MKLSKIIAKRSLARKYRVRSKVRAVSTLDYRVVVFKSNRYIYATLFSEKEGRSVYTVSSLGLKENLSKNKESAYKVGEVLGKYCLDKQIDKVAFDRGNSLYHGGVKSLADGLRSAGINL